MNGRRPMAPLPPTNIAGSSRITVFTDGRPMQVNCSTSPQRRTFTGYPTRLQARTMKTLRITLKCCYTCLISLSISLRARLFYIYISNIPID